MKSVEVKAQKMLSALRILRKTEKIDPDNMVRLYKSIVIPQLEYAAPVCKQVSVKFLKECKGGVLRCV